MKLAHSLFAFTFALLAACQPARSIAPRETARGAVLVTAQAFVELDHACAAAAIRKSDGRLAGKCADTYDAARAGLMVAANSIDAWDAASAGKTTCAIAASLKALMGSAELVKTSGGTVPSVVDDAKALVAVLGECK